MRNLVRGSAAVLIIVALLLVVAADTSQAAGGRAPQFFSQPLQNLQGAPVRQGPPLSQGALTSKFAQVTGQPDAIDLADLETKAAALEAATGRAGIRAAAAPQRAAPVEDTEHGLQANVDFNGRPQNETSIAIKPGTRGPRATRVIGANDYGIGTPVGGGVYGRGITYFPPFPLLAIRNPDNSLFTDTPAGTGDPALAYGTTRAGGGLTAGQQVVYYASLAFSGPFCANGIQVQRSLNDGFSWNRAVVPPLAPPKGVGFPAYHDKAADCSVFHDKEYITVDTTGGPHDGRVYITWSRFLFDAAGAVYKESPILMAWSDDNATTFSTPVVVSGSSATLCPRQVDGPAGVCDQDQASVPVVLANGSVAIAFLNEQGPNAGFNSGGRDQYLVTIYNPDTAVLEGPFRVAEMFDGPNDFPVQTTGGQGRSTLCNSNFRVWGAGNLAVGQDRRGGTALYVTFMDDKKHAGEFPFPTPVGPRSGGYACPSGKKTDTDVYLFKSTDLGRTWTDVTPAEAKGVNDQWYPWVAANDRGLVSLMFYDRSADAGNKLAHTTLAHSHDGGDSWSAQTVSDFASNFDDAFFGTGAFIGDYNGNAIDEGGWMHPVWTGVNPGEVDADVFTATVR